MGLIESLIISTFSPKSFPNQCFSQGWPLEIGSSFRFLEGRTVGVCWPLGVLPVPQFLRASCIHPSGQVLSSRWAAGRVTGWAHVSCVSAGGVWPRPGMLTTAPLFLPVWSLFGSFPWLQQQQLRSLWPAQLPKGMCDTGPGGKTIWAAGTSVFSVRRLIGTRK